MRHGARMEGVVTVMSGGTLRWTSIPSRGSIVSSAAVIRIVTQRFSPISGKDRCVTTLTTAAKDTRGSRNTLGPFRLQKTG